MRELPPSVSCPICQNTMRTAAMRRDGCDVEIHGRFAASEFSRLGADDLHFLRIFVLAEGRVRDMEGPLGLSYPTIRSRLAQLKEKLIAATQERALSPAEILERLESGGLQFEEALDAISKTKKAAKKK